MENGVTSITLFGRLVREIKSFTGTQVETFWVQMDDLGVEQAAEKVRSSPNCMEKYEVSQKVFQHLLDLSKRCPNELYGVVPFYMAATRNLFLPWQELERSYERRVN